jgi:hypothetical protein
MSQSPPQQTLPINYAQQKLALVWFIGAAIPGLILLLQALLGKYSDSLQEVWGWFVPTVGPALTQLCAWLANLIPNFDSNQHIMGHRQVKPGNGTDCPGKLFDLANQPNNFLRLISSRQDALGRQVN